MRWSATIGLLLAIVFVRAGDGAPVATDANLPEPIATRQTSFSIPFTLPPAEKPDRAPVKIELWVSADRGAEWKLSQTVEPGTPSFTFRAPHDGEYWFAIRTVGRDNRSRAEGDGGPELRVIVDTVQPRLELIAQCGIHGELLARWQAVDPQLKPESLMIEYQTPGSNEWRPIALETPPTPRERSAAVGQATLWSPDVKGGATLRARITDLAGNTTVAEATFEPARSTAGPELTIANRTPPPAERREGVTPWPADRASELPLGREELPGPKEELVRRPQGRFMSSGESDRASPDSADPPTAEELGPGTATPPVVPPAPPVRYDVGLPPGVRPQMLSSKSFEWDYEVESVGPTGIGRVELWATRNGGETWSSLAVDEDKTSPIAVVVDSEGLYGLRMTVTNGAGIGGRPPQAGDPPDTWVGVDVTEPVARLISNEVGTGERAGELMIRWQADDAALSLRPITLAFSANSAGPWSTIAAGIENTGQYLWHVDPRLPDRIFLRLEVRDEAGNQGVDQTAEPVALDRGRPQGRLLNLRPIGPQ